MFASWLSLFAEKFISCMRYTQVELSKVKLLHMTYTYNKHKNSEKKCLKEAITFAQFRGL